VIEKRLMLVEELFTPSYVRPDDTPTPNRRPQKLEKATRLEMSIMPDPIIRVRNCKTCPRFLYRSNPAYALFGLW
jgi:hypothetical protein